MDFRTFARESWFGPLDISLARLAEDDLAIGPTPIAKAPEEEFHKALSIANERHRAINWLADCSRVRYQIAEDALKVNGFLRRGGITRTIAALTIWRQSNPRLDASFEAPLAFLGSK